MKFSVNFAKFIAHAQPFEISFEGWVHLTIPHDFSVERFSFWWT
jgi:hypothetical protein